MKVAISRGSARAADAANVPGATWSRTTTAARREPSCRAAITTIAVVAFIASPFIALVPVMARHLTSGGPREVAGVTVIDGRTIGDGAVGPVTARIARLYQEHAATNGVRLQALGG